MPRLTLPKIDGTLETFDMPESLPFPVAGGTRNRIVYAAAHVVGCYDLPQVIDWDATLQFREYLWDCDLGVAEAMDTAQRGMGLSWLQARELIQRTLSASAKRKNALVACGCGTDQLIRTDDVALDDVIRAYEEQMAWVEAQGGRIILMASRALCAAAQSPDDYLMVYERLLTQARQPVIIHWLGEMFDPALAGYWGYSKIDEALKAVTMFLSAHATRIDGIKISLLDKTKEIAMRRELPASVRMYTGDDFDFAELIGGDAFGYSDALLGIFDAIAPAASAALNELASGRRDRFDQILAPCVPLSRHIFCSPTQFYKTGIVFMAWLNGYQKEFVMLGGQETKRSLPHLAEIFRLAVRARLLQDPELAVTRMDTLCRAEGITV